MAKVNSHVAGREIVKKTGPILDFSFDLKYVLFDAFVILGDLDADLGHGDRCGGFFDNVLEVIMIIWGYEDEISRTKNSELVFGDLEAFAQVVKQHRFVYHLLVAFCCFEY
jgi:hypothetical protein